MATLWAHILIARQRTLHTHRVRRPSLRRGVLPPSLMAAAKTHPALFKEIAQGNEAAVSAILRESPELINEARHPPAVPMIKDGEKKIENGGLGLTPLMFAMRRGADSMARLLLNHKADINLQDQLGKTAPMYAVEFGHGELSSLKDNLRAVNPRLKDFWGQSLTMYAAIQGDVFLIEELMGKTLPESKDVEDAGDGDEVYVLSAAHGHANVVTKLLEQRAREEGVKAALLTPHRALIQMCIKGHWIPKLVEAHQKEINMSDEDGLTPLMHAIIEGCDDVVIKLLDFGVNVQVSDTRKTATSPEGPDSQTTKAPKKNVLMLALESGKLIEPATVEKLVEKGAPTNIPSLDDPSMSLREIHAELTADYHVIGSLLNRAVSMRATQADEAMRLFNLARLCLSTAFYEQPGAALCAAVRIAIGFQEFADKIRLQDVDKANEFSTASQAVGLCVGALVSTLDESDRETLFHTVPGNHFLRLSAQAQRKKMLSSPAIKMHITKRWTGQLMFATVDGEGAYRWGGALLLKSAHRTYLTMIICAAAIANLILLPFVAIYPPLENHVKGFLERLGSSGVDKRISWRTTTAGGVPVEDGGSLSSGYSKELLLWWNSLYLLDVPWFKFFIVQLCNGGLLAVLITLAPCVDIFNLDDGEGCFLDSSWDTASLFPGDKVGESITGSGDVDGISRRFLKAAGKGRVGGGGNGDSGAGVSYVSSAPDHIRLPVSQGAAYLVLALLLGSQLFSALRHSPSIAPATTYASAAAGLLVCLFLALDHYNVVYPNVIRPEPGLYAMATFLQTIDISRALLLMTPSCGPYVLMLFSMLQDLAIWLWMLVSLIASFAAAVYINNTVEGQGTACSVSHDFFGYMYTLFEITMGGDTQVECNRNAKDYVSQGLMLLYYLMSMVLLMNMLIAMVCVHASRPRPPGPVRLHLYLTRFPASPVLAPRWLRRSTKSSTSKNKITITCSLVLWSPLTSIKARFPHHSICFESPGKCSPGLQALCKYCRRIRPQPFPRTAAPLRSGIKLERLLTTQRICSRSAPGAGPTNDSWAMA